MGSRYPRDLDGLNAIGHGHLPGLLGIRVTHVGDGVLTVEFEVRRELLAPNGFLHGGSVVALADTAAGYGCLTQMPEGAEGFTTLELKTNLLGTAREGRVRAEARAVHLGKTTQVWDVPCYADGGEKPIALFRCTQMILWPRAK